jgi:hypothetical protein
MGRIMHVFWDTDMRAGHHGLAEVAKKEGHALQKVSPGDYLCFINREQTMLKVLAMIEEKDTHGVLASYRSPHGRITLDAVQYIPQAFGASGFDMNKAIRRALEEKLKKRRVLKQKEGES